MKDQFTEAIKTGYAFKGDSIVLGGAMIDNECQNQAFVNLPLKMLNRHGLIAGATGSGKTKTLQILAEQLSAKGVPSLLMDIKGDLSGIAMKSDGHPKIDERHEKIGLPFEASAAPVEFLSISGEKGVKLKATVTEFGPVLLAKILDLNETQQGVLALIFKYCDDNSLPLIDLKDLRKSIQYITTDGKEAITAEYGAVSTASTGAILRKIIEIEQQGAEQFFGEPSFDVEDLCRTNREGKGIVSIIRLTDIQDKPKMFSTFMLSLLAEMYATFPEIGDMEKPKLAIFIDEAHLVFNEASDALLDQIESIIKLIRSKGVGIFFCTQVPTDVPQAVLGQLGLKIQHALRAFTANDRKSIKLTAQNYPESEFYNVEDLLTSLGIGEALVTSLNEKGIPTPLVHTLLRAPQSRMDVLTPDEVDDLVSKSSIVKKYNKEIDRESAYEILLKKMEKAQKEAEKKTEPAKKTSRSQKSNVEKVLNNSVTRQIGRTLVREITRGLLGVLGIKK